ncbi:MAG TPA: radical SAM protein [Candidatus Methylacidiphilales bacterium]|nr:radical SAM protein [Candidatus Methylacidiphilales bacterium]
MSKTEAASTASATGETLTINEIFYSIQGESTFAGRPCVFIRLTGCDLRCTYCDTEYAFYEGKKRTLDGIIAEIERYPCRLAEITGGEPLLQKRVHALMHRLCDAGYTVLIETGGAHDIASVDTRVHRIMDLKCPSSGECARNRMANLELLGVRDEVKFVIGTEEDYAWAKAQVLAGAPGWASRVNAILFSPVFGKMTPLDLATRIMAEALPNVRMQLQMHKIIWEPNQRGV